MSNYSVDPRTCCADRKKMWNNRQKSLYTPFRSVLNKRHWRLGSPQAIFNGFLLVTVRVLNSYAYGKDMKLIMACAYDPLRPGLARQGYMEVMGERMTVCFTSKQRAKQANYNMTWDIAKARDIMNNMFNKDAIAGIVFNPNEEKMVIILRDLLLPIMPGEKPKPEFYRK